jgi:putative transposase
VRRKLKVSERQACRAIEQPRSTQRYKSRRTTEEEKALLKEFLMISAKNPRYGYRRVWALLRREGFYVNKKRVHRLWRRVGLRVPARQRKRRRLPGGSENGCSRRQAEHKTTSGATTSLWTAPKMGAD